jgi:hypothetical protein
MYNPSLSPDRIESILGRATNWFHSYSPSRVAKWVLLSIAALYFIAMILFQTGPINCWAADVTIMLDGSWRIFNGQMPYRDFYLALGPLDYSLIALGMALTHASTQAIAVGNAIFGIIVGVWSWSLCRRQIPFAPTVLITAWVILTATSPSPLGAPANIMSPAMIYNRHGYAILSLILIECFFSLKRTSFWGGVSSGAAGMLTIFLKLNFFFAAVLLIFATFPTSRSELKRSRGILGGAGFVLLLALVSLRSAVIPFLYDMRYAIHSRIGGVGFGAALKLGISNVELLTALALTLITLMLVPRDHGWNKFAVRLALLCTAMVLSGLALRGTDFGEEGYQLALLWTILLIAKLVETYTGGKERIAIPVAVLLCLAGIFVPLAHDADSWRTLLTYQSPSAKNAASRVLGMEHMGLYPLDLATMAQYKFETGTDFADYLNDGVYLLNQWSRPNESVLTVGYSNPFPYLLRRKPAIGGSPWLHEGNDISKTHPLDPAIVFGNADLIMVPDSPSSHQDSDLDLQVIYHKFLVNHYSFVARSHWWTLYRRDKGENSAFNPSAQGYRAAAYPAKGQLPLQAP